LKYKRVRPAIKGRLARYPGIGDGCRRRRRQDRLPCTQIAGLDMTIIIQKKPVAIGQQAEPAASAALSSDCSYLR
jgi:hypothetical protein